MGPERFDVEPEASAEGAVALSRGEGGLYFGAMGVGADRAGHTARLPHRALHRTHPALVQRYRVHTQRYGTPGRTHGLRPRVLVLVTGGS